MRGMWQMNTKLKKKRSQRQEKDIAKTFGGKTVVASGALWGAKGDVRTDDFLIEAKYTDKEYYKLTGKIWEKIHREAIADRGRIPLMVIDIQEQRYVVYDAEMMGYTQGPHTGGYFNSVRIYKGMCGYNDFGDYIHGMVIGIRGVNNHLLTVALYDDFERMCKRGWQ